MKKLLAYALILVLGVTFFAVSSDTAHAQTAPPDLNSGVGFCNRSIIVDDDLFCQFSYELPQSIADGVSDAWCAELEDPDGCDGTPADPTNPTSLAQGKAQIALYDNCGADCSAADLIAITRAPRIWHGVAGIYLDNTTGITWADADINICIETPAGAFTSVASECVPPAWSNAANSRAEQREDAGERMVVLIESVETARADALNTLVTGDRITAAGQTYAREAFEIASIIFPQFFLNSISTINDSLPTPNPSQLEADLEATATAIRGSYETIGRIFTPTGGPELGALILFGALGIVTFVFMYRVTGEFIWPSIGMAAWGLFGVVAGGIDTQVVFIYILMISLPAMVWLYRRIGYA